MKNNNGQSKSKETWGTKRQKERQVLQKVIQKKGKI